MQTLGLGFTWEELSPGQRFRTLNRTITETDLVLFTGMTGMLETIFTDRTFAAEKGAIQGQFVPAALTYSLIEGLLCQSMIQGTGLAMLELNQQILAPVRVGDTVHGEIEITSVRPTSKGNRGIVVSRIDVKNQQGEVVMTYEATRLLAGRSLIKAPQRGREGEYARAERTHRFGDRRRQRHRRRDGAALGRRGLHGRHFGHGCCGGRGRRRRDHGTRSPRKLPRGGHQRLRRGVARGRALRGGVRAGVVSRQQCRLGSRPKFLDTAPDFWRKVVAINLFGPLNVSHVVLRGMAARGFGRVVNIASDAGRVGSSGEAVYSACKGGIIALTKTLARELVGKGVILNTICPGPTDTAILRSFLEGAEGARIAEGLKRAIPMRRFGAPEDYPGLVAFLLSDDAAYMTGQTISVSGGLTMHG
jgi:NAD(P)-dependent dehydrogenase (short-subunit alcohol dehydrogenase family)/acyl dehydratase